jgi:DNA-binding NarL/FixJ family response regulator
MKKLTAPSRIMIVDDHPLMRDGLKLRITSQDDLEVCGEAATEGEAFDLAKRICPDLVLVDISLKCGNGIELVKRIKSLGTATKMLVVSTYPESLYAERAMRAGAMGYLNKQETNEKLIDAIRVVLGGERYASAEMTQRFLAMALGKRSETQDPIELLSDRELEIYRLIGTGFTTGAIAEQLFLSTHTIDTHRENIKRKLGCKTGAELSRQAMQSMLESS